MEFKNTFKEEWEAIESPKTLPRYVRSSVEIPFDEFKNKVLEQDPKFVKSVVKSFYSGDVWILKETFPPKFMIDLRKKMHEYGQNTPSEFHKMLEGCPNFHRIIDTSVAKNYSFQSLKHSHYFFPWNEDPFNLFEETYKRWNIIKIISGLRPNEYRYNTPKDGIVDRLQIVHYPSGTGKIETHSDPYLNQRLIISGIMSKRGKDYTSGGAYFVDKDNIEVDFEDKFDVGDFAIYFPTIHHGVKIIDEGKKTDWNSIEGRWWFGPFSNSSDQVKERHTGYAIKDPEAKGNI